MRVASPTIDLVVHRCDRGRVVVRVCGVPGRSDAAILRRTLDDELDRAPDLLVVELDRAVSTPELREVLATARDRARCAGGGLRVVTAVGHAREITDLL
ncbi:hypothetical protein [Actinomycetospora soli]|uniref:hypothetical protein n=1 Tax=Actinomycetospora soli TaxID=2893887 RepID=UPI001E4711EC|nr:hypothetical protein [Actinomycetospora soli]MCD2186921.1 hypothetical protein [Actinomycetospora soli]